MKVLGIIGWSGSGKTTLLTAMITVLKARGLTVSTIKHAHHALKLDQPGKDSYRHRHAGAEETILANAARFALFREHRTAPEPGLGDLLARLAPVDIVLVEGFKRYECPKLEVYRPALGKPALWNEMAVIGVASDAALPECRMPVVDLNQAEAVTDFVLTQLELKGPSGDQRS